MKAGTVCHVESPHRWKAQTGNASCLAVASPHQQQAFHMPRGSGVLGGTTHSCAHPDRLGTWVQHRTRCLLPGVLVTSCSPVQDLGIISKASLFTTSCLEVKEMPESLSIFPSGHAMAWCIIYAAEQMICWHRQATGRLTELGRQPTLRDRAILYSFGVRSSSRPV